MQRRIEQPDNSANESTEGPQHLPEGQYCVENCWQREERSALCTCISLQFHTVPNYILYAYIHNQSVLYIYTGIKNRIFCPVEWISHGCLFLGVCFKHRFKTKEVLSYACVCVYVYACLYLCDEIRNNYYFVK